MLVEGGDNEAGLNRKDTSKKKSLENKAPSRGIIGHEKSVSGRI